MLYSRCGGLLRLTGRYATSRTPFLCREGVAGTGGFQLPLAGRGKEVEAEGESHPRREPWEKVTLH